MITVPGWLIRRLESVRCLLALPALLCACGGGADTEPGGLVPPDFGPIGAGVSDAAVPSGCGLPAGVACELMTGCGCPSGAACRIAPERIGAASCVPLAEALQGGYSSCEVSDSCPELHSCISSVCKQHCRVAEDCGWEGARCVPANAVNGDPLAIGYCQRDCDVAAPQAPDPGFRACGAGLHCGVVEGGTDCTELAGTGLQGAACTSRAQCAPGLYCSSEGRCEQWCKLGADDCGNSLHCIPSQTPLLVQGRELGTCACRPAPGTPCDPGLGCGCSAGATCGLVGDAVGCRPLSASPRAEQARCTGDAECPALHTCVGAVCQRQCVVASDCGWPGATCLPLEGGADRSTLGLSICSRNCDPVWPQAPSGDQQPCGPGAQCVPYSDGPLCVLAGAGNEGDSCIQDECAAGLFCGRGQKCQRWCNVGGDVCGSGRTCRGFEPALLSSGKQLGRCICQPADGSRCDPRTDCGCEPGGTCGFFGGPDPFDCRVLAPLPVPPHEACSGDASCPALHSCIDGVCKRLCVEPADCPAPGSRCLPVSEEPNFSAWKYCSISCDPVSPRDPRQGLEACGTNVQCVAATAGADCFAPAGLGGEGAPCQSSADCLPGSLCGLAGLCQAYCEIGGADCGAQLACAGFDFLLRSADREFGRCVSAPYASCTDSASCPDLHFCVRGACSRLCSNLEDCDGSGSSCTAVRDAQDQPIEGFNTCIRDCDPVSPSAPREGLRACGAGAQCFVFDAGPDCAGAGSGALREPCQTANDCLPGLFCSIANRCQRWCTVGGTDCAAPQQCLSFDLPLVTGDNEWGSCVFCSQDCAAPNGVCEDGGANSESALCTFGTDCTDCGLR